MDDTRVVYEKGQYKVYKSNHEYIVHNSNICNSFAHSHIKNLNSCKYVIDLLIKKKVRGDVPLYLIGSMIRLADNEHYKKKLEQLFEKKSNSETRFYYNPNKGVRK